MNLSIICIHRPVLTIVISLLLVVFGAVGFSFLGVREYPSVDPPVITVSTSYSGAEADVIESQITEVIEEEVSAIAGIETIQSTSRQGSSQIRIEFSLETDLESAANDVRDRVGRVASRLPDDANPPVVRKADADAEAVFGFVLRGPGRDPMELSYLADRVKEKLQTIDGISSVDLIGEKRYAMRLWLRAPELASFGLTPLDVRGALLRENVELPAGRIEGGSIELAIRTLSRLATPEEFGAIVVKRDGERLVRLRDVARVELAPANDRLIFRMGDEPMIGIYVSPIAGANQVAIVDEILARYPSISADLPADVRLQIAFDTTQYVRASIAEVKETVLVAFALVIVVILAFLRSWRSTLIPVVVIPISIVANFLILHLCGFSINVLTLLGVVLAIGLVVDDAIVVLENIYAKIEQGMTPLEAGVAGSREIFFAVVSTTLTLAAVFLPIVFMAGLTGRLFREFAVTVAGAVFISALVALTLTPMLGTRLLRGGGAGWLYRTTEPGFVALNRAYAWLLGLSLRRLWVAPVLLVAAVAASVVIFRGMPRELAPLEDRGRLQVRATAVEGASFDYMDRQMRVLTDLVLAEVPETAVAVTQAPAQGGQGAVNSGYVRVFLSDRAERSRSQMEIADRLQRSVNQLDGLRASIVQTPTIGERRGSGQGAQLVIQAADMDQLEATLPEFIEAARTRPEFSFVDTDLKFNRPELHVSIDRDRARVLGISAADVAQTIQIGMGGQRVGYFVRHGKQYEVIAQVQRDERRTIGDLRSLSVRSASGGMVPLENVVTVAETSGTPQRARYNRYAAATVTGTLAGGYTLGDGVTAMKVVADDVLGDEFTTSFAGASLEFVRSANSLGYAFLLALLLIYLILAAQFESFRGPLVIMLTVPLSLAGALLALWACGQSLNIFSQIGLIVLVGLVTKNGILIVEYANQRSASGIDWTEAVRGAAAARFRPILMTSLSTMLGALPIALALGAGSESRQSLGIALIGGMFFGTLLTLFVIPAMLLTLGARGRVGASEAAQAALTPPSSGAPALAVPVAEGS